MKTVIEIAREVGAYKVGEFYPEGSVGLMAFETDELKRFAELVRADERAKLAEQPTQKRPQNCGTGHCSCIECVMEPAQQYVSVTDELVDAYCKAWEQSFTADKPYDTVMMPTEARKHVEVGLKAAMAAQPAQQEPVAWIWKYANGEEEVVFVPPRHICATHVDAPSTITPLYTTPQAQPAREFVGLTDEEIRSMCKQTWVFETVKHWVRVIEAAHNIKEKNT